MVLSDKDIQENIEKGEIVIKPFNKESLQPSSYDLHLSSKFIIFDNYTKEYIDVKSNDEFGKLIDITDKGYFIIHPGEFVLGATIEYVKIPSFLVARIEGKSSLGRLGLIIHATAGYVDPGFEGTLTLEITNLSRLPIKIYPDMKIAQLAFQKMLSIPSKLYGEYNNKYQGQIDPTSSKLWKDFVQ
ncbi:dCTP deaminase [Patescibacteria group bacterium]|nr:dCTP deaminase [Patescibacteria group bacterium]